MSKQPEALRLAEFLEMHWCNVDMPEAKAAAELRRLSAENESLRQIVQDFPPVEAELREVSDRAHRLEAQRGALLEALKWLDKWMSDKTIPECVWKVRAAIKAVEAPTFSPATLTSPRGSLGEEV